MKNIQKTNPRNEVLALNRSVPSLTARREFRTQSYFFLCCLQKKKNVVIIELKCLLETTDMASSLFE